MNTEQWIAFAEAGNQQRLSTQSGQNFQGWIMEISDEALMISTGFAEKSGQDAWLKFEDLTQAELYFWDNKNDLWVEFKI